MNKLTDTDLSFILARLPKDVIEMMVKNPKILVGGGFIRATIAGEKVSDIDVFGPSKEVVEQASKDLAYERKARIVKTKNAITVLCPGRIPVQFITRWVYEDMEGLVNSFDFTICQSAVSRKANPHELENKWDSCIADSFYSDLAARRLVYTMPSREEDSGGSMLRVRKFLARGYNIQAPSLAGIIANIMTAVDPNKVNMNDKHAVAKVVSGLLREVDPLILVDGDVVDEHEGGTR